MNKSAYRAGHISQANTSKKLKVHAGREAIAAQVGKKNTFAKTQTRKNGQITKG
jgi:hypothetical protein